MKHFVFFSVVIALIYLPMSGFTHLSNEDVEKRPYVQVQDWFLKRKQQLDNHIGALQKGLEEAEATESLLKKYKLARTEFKTIEFLFSYVDPQLYNQYINGAPLPKLMKKVPEQIVIEPGGFQRLDELMFEDEMDYAATLEVVEKLRYDLNSFSEQTARFRITDPVVFEAARFGVLRIKTLGVIGFDRPGNTDDALKETAVSLKGIYEALRFYEPYVDEGLWVRTTNTFKYAALELNEGVFESFDRVAFHVDFVNPLWGQLLEVQKSLNVELPNQRFIMPQAVNYESSGLFDNDFLNVNFYAQYADDPRDSKRISLGRILFFDPVLSHNNQRACASCHAPNKAYTDGLASSATMNGEPGLRNAPTIINSVFAERFFHDMRTDNLASQMDHVVLNPKEFDSDYFEIVDKLKSSDEYMALFRDAYGEEGITKNSVTHAVTRYVASLRSYNSDFDKYMRGEKTDLDPAAIRGYNLFSGKAACATCHFAPTFAGLVPPNFLETESEVLGVPRVFEEPYELDPDEGRFMNYILKEQAPFYRFAFKTPTIRNVELTGPYMHNGALKTLEEVMDFYNQGGGLGLGLDLPNQTLPPDALELTDSEIQDIIAFMKSLTDTTGMNSVPTYLPSFGSNDEMNNRPLGGAY